MAHENEGFISLYRSILNWEWYSDVPTRCLFIHLLLTVEYKSRRIMGKNIKRGQRLCSIRTLAREVGLSERQVRTALNHLKATHEVTHLSSPEGTVITIKNYDMYQIATQQSTHEKHQKIDTPTDTAIDTVKNRGKRSARAGLQESKSSTDTPADTGSDKRPTQHRHTYISNKYNNIPPISPKGDVGVFEKYAGDDLALLQSLADFDAMRKKIRKPMTDRAKTMLTAKLDTLAGSSKEKIAILDESVLHCWQSVYPLKDGVKEQDDEKERY